MEASKKQYKCNLCGNLFVYKNRLIMHIRKCETRQALGEQFSTGTEKKQFECVECKMLFKCIRKLLIHKRKHHGERPYACKTCSKTFTHKYRLRNHMITHTDFKPHVCDQCGTRFCRAGSLREHLKIRHKDRPYLCQYCGHLFDTQFRLMTHLVLHTGKDKALTTKRRIKEHYVTHPREESDLCHLCDYCGLLFLNKEDLKVHTVFKHTGGTAYECMQCQKVFVTPNVVPTHYISHERRGFYVFHV